MHVANTLDRPPVSEEEARLRRYTAASLDLARAIDRRDEADERWAQELRLTFGSRASTARYTVEGRGIPGSRLRAFHDEFAAAHALYENATRRYRAVDSQMSRDDRIGALVTDECRCARCRA